MKLLAVVREEILTLQFHSTPFYEPDVNGYPPKKNIFQLILVWRVLLTLPQQYIW